MAALDHFPSLSPAQKYTRRGSLAIYSSIYRQEFRAAYYSSYRHCRLRRLDSNLDSISGLEFAIAVAGPLLFLTRAPRTYTHTHTSALWDSPLTPPLLPSPVFRLPFQFRDGVFWWASFRSSFFVFPLVQVCWARARCWELWSEVRPGLAVGVWMGDMDGRWVNG